MAQIRIDLAETLLDGMDIKFKAPCPCSGISGLAVYYPKEDGETGFKELVFRDSHGNDLTGIGNLFSKDAYVKVIADTVNGYAYLQNADNNGFLNSAIFGTYTHDAENLIGWGENGKFKATVSGTISSINVNGVSHSVKCGEDSTMDLVAGCWYTFILDGNTVNFSSGGAGGGLNFKVVGSATEPVSPSENMIWVNTSTPITGWTFSATKPEAPADGQDGPVWIQTSAASTVEFNALKKNGIQIYPISAKQHVGGAWVDVTAKSYQNGAWVDWWDGHSLFFYGNEMDAATGGWIVTPAYWSKSGDGSKPADMIPSVNSRGGYTLKHGIASGGAIWHTKNKIDTSKISTIKFVGSMTSGSHTGMALYENIEFCSKHIVAELKGVLSQGTHTLTVPSDCGDCYVGFYVYNNQTINVDEVIME